MRIGILCSGRPQAWQLACIEALATSADAQPLLDSRTHDLPERLAGLPRVSFGDRDEGAGLDVVVVLTAPDVEMRARHGLWMFRLGKAGARAALAGVPELAAGEPAVQVRIERSTESGPRPVVAETVLATLPGLRACRDRILAECPHLLTRALRLTALGRPPRAGIDEPPWRQSALEVPKARLRVGLAWVRILFEIFWKLETWRVGVTERSPADIVRIGELGRVRWLPAAGRRRFHADPFALEHEGRTHVLAEAYDHADPKGTIEAIALEREGRWRPAIELGVHLSYPFLLRHEGEVWCLPEASEGGNVPRYRAAAFPTGWERIEPPLIDAPLVDATVVEHEGRFWLFATRADDDPLLRLFVWHGPSPFGPWTPHAQNPVLCDVRRARPAGPLFRAHGDLIRPAQDSSRTYGGALVLARVLTLTPEVYEEEVTAVLRPDPAGPCPHGMHHICPVGGVAVVDGKRWRLDALAWLLKRRLKRARQARVSRPRPGGSSG